MVVGIIVAEQVYYGYLPKTGLLETTDSLQVTLERFLPLWQIAILLQNYYFGLEERGKNQSGLQTEVSFQYTGAKNWMPTR